MLHLVAQRRVLAVEQDLFAGVWQLEQTFLVAIVNMEIDNDRHLP
jgi:hypothetical protein